MGNWCVFAFCGFILDFGGMAVCYSFIFRRRLRPPTPPSQKKKSRMWKLHVLAFARLHPWFLGNGSLLFHFFHPQNPNHFTLIVFAGSKFVKERWCACLLHLYHNTTGKWRASSLGPKVFSLFATRKTGQQSLILLFIGSYWVGYLVSRCSKRKKKKLLVLKTKRKCIMASTLKWMTTSTSEIFLLMFFFLWKHLFLFLSFFLSLFLFFFFLTG